MPSLLAGYVTLRKLFNLSVLLNCKMGLIMYNSLLRLLSTFREIPQVGYLGSVSYLLAIIIISHKRYF